MILEETRVMPDFLKVSINVSSESFETGYNFSERSKRVELRSSC